MPIQVTHGPHMGMYGGVVADSARQQGQKEEDQAFAEFMMALQGQQQDYKLGTRGLDIDQGQLNLGEDQLEHQKYIDVERLGLDVERLGLDVERLDLDRLLGMSDVDLRAAGLNLQERELIQNMKIAELNAFMENPQNYRRWQNGGSLNNPRGYSFMSPFGRYDAFGDALGYGRPIKKRIPARLK